jgi:hypothetical protein
MSAVTKVMNFRADSFLIIRLLSALQEGLGFMESVFHCVRRTVKLGVFLVVVRIPLYTSEYLVTCAIPTHSQVMKGLRDV